MPLGTKVLVVGVGSEHYGKRGIVTIIYEDSLEEVGILLGGDPLGDYCQYGLVDVRLDELEVVK